MRARALASFPRPAVVAVVAVFASLALAACDKPVPEPVKAEPTKAASPETASPVASGATPEGAPEGAKKADGAEDKPGADAVAVDPATAKGGDPLAGKWTLADALKDVKPGKGALVAKIDTTKGALECTLLEEKAPVTVANFVGLASGKRPWKDPKTGAWVTRPAYDGTTFHRIIKGFMIQGGDSLGNGSGEPGYVIKDELWAGAKHDRAGLLCMANRGPNTNGAQFFVTDDSAPHLDGNYTIFGECAPVSVVHDIANVEVRGETPKTAVVIRSVKIARK